MAHHLVGLQAQENLPPYFSLAARLDDFDPHAVTRGLEDRSLVRLRGDARDDPPADRRRRADAAAVDPALPGARAPVEPERQGGAPPRHRRGERRDLRRAARRAVADEGARRGDGDPLPRRTRRPRSPSWRGSTSRSRRCRRAAPGSSPAASSPVRRPLARPPARRRRTRPRSCAATCAPSGRRPPPTSARGPG